MYQSKWLAGVVAPLIFLVVILAADTIEGPKTAFVGVLAVVPMFSAVFGTPLMTALVSVITLLSGFLFGLTASDGNVAAQNVRLVIIALVSVVAIVASFTRRRMQRALTNAQVSAEKTRLIEQQAHTDSMTGLLNRRGLTRAVGQLEPGHRSLAIIDCDKLKNVNDTRGHLVGDEFITAIAKRLANGVSSRDVVARWGGDEFIVVMNAPAPESAAIVERLMAKVSDTEIATTAGPISATVTAGLADWPTDQDIDAPLRLADNALYEAKQAGRGTLVTSSATA